MKESSVGCDAHGVSDPREKAAALQQIAVKMRAVYPANSDEPLPPHILALLQALDASEKDALEKNAGGDETADRTS